MSEGVTVEKTKILEDFIKLPDFDKLQGHGGAFLVVPLDQYKIFSKEQFTEDQKMFANAALEYAVNRMKPLKEELKTLNKDLTLEIIKELFEKSVEGEAYDLEKYGQYFRPAGMAYQANPQVVVPTASAPATETAPVAAPVTESAPAPQPAAATAPAGDSAKRAEDILKLIRSRQAK